MPEPAPVMSPDHAPEETPICVTVLRSAPNIDPRSMHTTTTAAFLISILYPTVGATRATAGHAALKGPRSG